MRKLTLFTLSFSSLTGLGVLAFLYQLWATDIVSIIQPRSASFAPAHQMLTRSEAEALNQAKEQQAQQTRITVPVAAGIQANQELIDYSILPDSPQTARAKQFLVDIRSSGYVGEHATFQRALDQLHTYQILSNMLLLKKEAAVLRTVLISPNMLNRQQLESSYDMTQRLLRELKEMYMIGECSDEQEEVLNIALARLTYLTRMFNDELEKYKVITQSEPLNGQLSSNPL